MASIYHAIVALYIYIYIYVRRPYSSLRILVGFQLQSKTLLFSPGSGRALDHRASDGKASSCEEEKKSRDDNQRIELLLSRRPTLFLLRLETSICLMARACEEERPDGHLFHNDRQQQHFDRII